MNILITGASRGIGAAAFELLKSSGHTVVGHSSRGSDELVAGELTDPAAPRDIWDTALDELGGRIDVLVNSAGVNVQKRSMAELSPDDWDFLVRVNATGAYNCIRSVLPQMRERRDGVIVNVSSVAGRRGWANAAAYCAAKFALTGFTQALAAEGRPHGIRACVLYPGAMDTSWGVWSPQDRGTGQPMAAPQALAP
ncbi:MAG: SDR family oxidoreductase, partial [Proteobacteria bacterium]|nr:SDR family oxidoreductase [Pseudomonadota bacterium]